MDITTLTQLIDAFRAETAQNAITPDTLGQLLQKIVNLLGDAADSATMQQLTTWYENITRNQALVKNIRATTTEEKITFYVEKINATTGATSTSSFSVTFPKYAIAKGSANGYVQLSLTDDTGSHEYSTIKIYGASTTAAGIMTAADKTKLDNTAAGLNSLANEVALKATKYEVEQITEWEDKVKSVGDVVKSVNVSPDSEKMFMRLNKASLENGRDSVDNILIPHVTEQRAGVMSAEDFQNLQTLVEKSESEDEQGQDTTARKSLFPISVEPKGMKLFVHYSVELTEQGYVPYLFRYSKRRTHFGKTQSGGEDRVHGEIRKGWHRNYNHQRIKLSGYEIQVGRLTNPESNNPVWDYLNNGPRELFGQILDLTNNAGQWIGYRFSFGKKMYKFSPASPSHKFTFGIAFGKPLSETNKNAYPHQMVTDIEPFHVMVTYNDSYNGNVQGAPELHIHYCI